MPPSAVELGGSIRRDTSVTASEERKTSAINKLEQLRTMQFDLYRQHIEMEEPQDEDHGSVLRHMLEPGRQNTPFHAFDEYGGSSKIDDTIDEMEKLCKEVQNFPVEDLVMDEMEARGGGVNGGGLGLKP
jgi:hypothetical protein